MLAALALPAAADAKVVDAGPLKGRVGDRVEVRVAPAGPGVTAVHLRGPVGAKAVRITFPAVRGELFTGFGQRSNAIDQRGREVLNYTADGPFLERDRAIAGAVIPDWAEADRPDATYYPIPWLLSSRGYGVLLDNDETSVFHLGTQPADVWAPEVQGRVLAFRVFAGPTP